MEDIRDKCRLCLLPMRNGVDLFESVDNKIPLDFHVKEMFQIEVTSLFVLLSCFLCLIVSLFLDISCGIIVKKGVS